jgi:lipid II:glycine glycyltransferase (peptidoglycan interpeptide bridge formation enzyme)
MKKVFGKKWCVKRSKKNHEPAQTLMLDLRKSEDEILAEMKQKTRYNIRLAEKRGVEIKESQNLEKDIEIFYEISRETAERDKISIHPFEYYQKMVTEINSEKIKLYLAKYENQVIGAIIIRFFGGMATYLHGASSNLHRNVMVNYAIQWRAIQDAKSHGCEKYDFGGIKITEENNKNSWQGITRFKLSFAPKEKIVDFPGCWDIVINKRRYFTYRALQYLKDLI